MNVLFLSLSDYETLNFHGLYSDLMRQFIKNGHEMFVISPIEKRKGKETYIINEPHTVLLKLKIGDMQKTNMIKKGISTLTIEKRIINGIKKYFSDVKFNLILYTTPPITFCGAVEYIRRRDNAISYLILKDIFPQNSLDIGVLSNKGLIGFIYRYFRNKEKKLYRISDYIGCMSQANVNYILEHNSEINPAKVEECPNSTDPINMSVDAATKIAIRKKYDIPLDKRVFVYGGNLGKPQGIDFLIKCIQSQRDNKEVFFLVVGNGTEYGKLETFFKQKHQGNFKLMKRLPKEDYDTMVGACDIGMIFLDHRFTIPNFPSRLLAYMQAGLPILACTDPNTDIGSIIVKGDFGWWCESNDLKGFATTLLNIKKADLNLMGKNSFRYLKNHYSSEISYRIIMKHFEKN